MKDKILIGVVILGVIGVGFLGFKLIQSASSKETEAECFTFDKETGTISDYLLACGTEVVIPEKIDGVTVTTLASHAFMDKKLEKVTIPGTVVEIGIGAFYNNSIKTLKLNEGTQVIKATAFLNNKIEKLEIPTTVTTIGIEAFNNNSVNDKQAFIYSRNEDGTENKTILVGYAGKTKDVTIPDGVEIIYLDAFAECGLTGVKFSSSVERIEFSAFSENSITSVTIPKNIMQIGENAFAENEIEKITINGKSSKEEFNYLGNNWDNGCTNVKYNK